MLGDLNIAEPKALIGFAGPRVIEQAIRQKLPEGFQRSEFLLEKGMIDFIVDRREMKTAIANALRFAGRRVRAVPALPPATTSRRRGAELVDPLSYLFALEPIGIKFGLENIDALVSSLGHPERAYRTIHVAGTNGKGSVTAMADAALAAAGHRTARYTSPHLVDIRERFTIEGQPVGAPALDGAIEHVRAHIDALRAAGTLDVQPTFFEVTTAIAFELFRRAGVDVAVIEVGLGGRLDATNVVTPDATAITSIAFDHEQYLGHSLREIAIEKAGIIKPRRYGRGRRRERRRRDGGVIERVAVRERGAPLVRAWEGVTVASPHPPTCGRPVECRCVAACASTITATSKPALAGIRLGTPSVAVRAAPGTLNAHGRLVPPAAIVHTVRPHRVWPGRLERRTAVATAVKMLLDAAHNTASAGESLASYLKEQAWDERLPLVFLGVMRDKDVDGDSAALLAPAVGSHRC